MPNTRLDRVQDTLSAHRNELVSLLSRLISDCAVLYCILVKISVAFLR